MDRFRDGAKQKLVAFYGFFIDDRPIKTFAKMAMMLVTASISLYGIKAPSPSCLVRHISRLPQ